MVEIDRDWHFPYFDENMGRAVTEDYDAADVLLIGHETYDSFAGAWPARESAGGLLAAGLVDELRLLVHPVAARKGRPLFDDRETPYHLAVNAVETFPTGVIRVQYAPVAAPDPVGAAPVEP